MTIIRNCKKHGETVFNVTGTSKIQIRCRACGIEAVQRRREKLKVLAVDYKGGKCEKCGYSKCIEALDFHHKNPNEKDFGISAKGYTRAFDKVKIELDKCLLLCANCHREEHFNLRN